LTGIAESQARSGHDILQFNTWNAAEAIGWAASEIEGFMRV